MRKHLNNPIVSGTLALLAIAFLLYSVMGDSSSSSYGGYEETEEYDDYEDEYDDSFENEDGQPTRKATFDSKAMIKLASVLPSRNMFSRPVRPVEAPKPSSPEQEMISESVLIKGVWVQGVARYAAVDNLIMREGESYKRIAVERIESSGVWIRYDQQNYFIQPGQSWTYQYSKPIALSEN